MNLHKKNLIIILSLVMLHHTALHAQNKVLTKINGGVSFETPKVLSAGRWMNLNNGVLNLGLTAGSGVTIDYPNRTITSAFASQAYTAGAGITITGGEISATSTAFFYSAGTGISITNNQVASTIPIYSAGTNISIVNNTISSTAATYTAGTNISIAGNTISSTIPVYSAGTGISINNNVISATGGGGGNGGGDISAVTAGNGLTGGGTSGDVTLNVLARNGLTTRADEVILGGELREATTITHQGFDLTHSLNTSGDFIVRDNGADVFSVKSEGDVVVNDASTSTADFRVRSGASGGSSHLLFVDASKDAVGIATNSLSSNFHTGGSVSRSAVATPTGGNLTLNEGHYLIRILSSVSSQMNITLPNPITCAGREYIFVNNSTSSHAFTGSFNYIDETGAVSTTIPPRSVLYLVSDGGSAWFKIDN